jgi:hypothetical protein
MRARVVPVLATALALVLGGVARCVGSAEASGHRAAETSRGTDPYPLRAWMRDNMAPSMVERDVAGLVRAFARAAELAPEGYRSWAAIARGGAESAARGEFEGARQACKQCHDEFRERYRAERRSAPLP